MAEKGVKVLMMLIILEKITFYNTKYIFVWLLNRKLSFTEKDTVVLYHGFFSAMYVCTIILYHLRNRGHLMSFVTAIFVCYLLGFVLLLALLWYPTLIRALFAAMYLCLLLGFAGTRCFLMDFLRVQMERQHFQSFCLRSAFVVMGAVVGLNLVLPFVYDDLACPGDTDCYFLGMAVSVTVMAIAMFTFLVTFSRDGAYRIPSQLIQEQNFKYLIGVILVPLYQVPKQAVLLCFGLQRDKSFRPRSYLEYAYYAFPRPTVLKQIRIWRIVYLMMPLLVNVALIEQQSSRWVFSAYRTDRRLLPLRHDDDLFDRFYIHPVQFQLLNPLLHAVLVPLFGYLIFPLMEGGGQTKRDRIHLIGMLMSTAFLFSGILSYRQTTQGTTPLTSHPQKIVTNVVSGFDAAARMEIKDTVANRTMELEPLGGMFAIVRESEPLVRVFFRMTSTSVVEDFELRTENTLSSRVQTVFIHRQLEWGRERLLVDRHYFRYVRPSTFAPTFRIFFANVTPIYELSLLTTVGRKWQSIPVNAHPKHELTVHPGLYRYAVNTNVSQYADILIEYGAYYDAVAFTDGHNFGLRFTQKVGPILVSWTTVLYQYLFLIIAECVFFMDVTKLFLSQSQDLEIQQTVVLFWYLIRALGNLLVVAINEVGIGFYKRDDYQFIFGLLLALSRTFYPPMAKAYRPVLGTDDMVKSH